MAATTILVDCVEIVQRGNGDEAIQRSVSLDTKMLVGQHGPHIL